MIKPLLINTKVHLIYKKQFVLDVLGQEKIQEKMAGRKKKYEQKGAAFDNEATLIFYIKQVAARNSVSNYQIAEQTGIDRAQISRILNGQKSPTISTLFKICYVLKIRIAVEAQGLWELAFAPPDWPMPGQEI
ncbi:MAG: XRE family transcriptional regulator [Caulobacteraceae bacterium]|nr:XRE family transcriptional regulator [Caulobacteraceae bacterium]